MVLAVDPAIRRDACFVCGGLEGLLAIAPGDAFVCPPCAVDVARLLVLSSHAMLASWFVVPASERSTEPTSIDATVGKLMGALGDEPQAGRDLAVAFEEMGCHGEAIRLAATTIVAEAPRVHPAALRVALLAAARKPGCLAGIARAIRDQRRDAVPRAVRERPLINADDAAVAQVQWTAFECDGHAFEYLAVPTLEKTRPAGWPSHKAAPGRYVATLLLSVRKRGEAAGAGVDLPAGTDVTVVHAREAARRMWKHLMRGA